MSATNDEIGLKPCPFCGGTYITFCHDNGGHLCECASCYTTTIQASSKEIAASYWNKRVDVSFRDARIKELEVENDKLKSAKDINEAWITKLEAEVATLKEQQKILSDLVDYVMNESINTMKEK